MKIQQRYQCKKVGKIIFLCLANSVLIPVFAMGFYPLGYYVFIMGTVFQLVLVCINYLYIRTTWKMCVMDVASLCSAVAGSWGANYLYEKNISNDAVGKAVFGLFLIWGLILSIFAILFAMARAFHRDGDRKKESAICGVLGVGIVAAALLFFLLI